MKQSQSWKSLERLVAQKLGGRRVLRGANFSQKDTDVELPDFPHWALDCKYRAKHAHHRFLAEIRKKYCGPGNVPVLITKARSERGAVVSMSLDDFACLLAALRGLKKAWREDNSAAWGAPRGEHPELTPNDGVVLRVT